MACGLSAIFQAFQVMTLLGAGLWNIPMCGDSREAISDVIVGRAGTLFRHLANNKCFLLRETTLYRF
jgi:hypothetical protein